MTIRHIVRGWKTAAGRVLLPALALAFAVEGAVTTSAAAAPPSRAEYLAARDSLLARDRSHRRSASLAYLSGEEARADSVLEAMKAPWLRLPTHLFPPAARFHRVKAAYDSMQLLEVMDRMPKGAMLHAHPSATGSFLWLLEKTRDPRAWIRLEESTAGPAGTLAWGEQPPEGEGWVRVIQARGEAADSAAFDRRLLDWITLTAEDYGPGDVWLEFERNFGRIWRMVAHPDIWRSYMVDTCLRLAEQGVLYLEFHTGIQPIPGPEGGEPSTDHMIRLWREVRDTVASVHPGFDLKLIAAAGRVMGEERITAYLREVARLRAEHPDFVLGFDLVNEEDRTPTNLELLDAVLSARRLADSLGTDLPAYVHSGESNRLDNENLADAVLWDARRIGHGYALARHPVLMEVVKRRGIALEVNPVSNQALGYVQDLRNHPAVVYLAHGVPIVLSPDDPGMMDYRWAHDWVAATLGWDLDLLDLRQLVLDSFRFSGMTVEERERTESIWQARWEEFVAWLASRQVRPPLLPGEEKQGSGAAYGP